jgi:hypothetical protein
MKRAEESERPRTDLINPTATKLPFLSTMEEEKEETSPIIYCPKHGVAETYFITSFHLNSETFLITSFHGRFRLVSIPLHCSSNHGVASDTLASIRV